MRVFNFSAGPAALPEEVLRQAQAEMLDWHGKGVSVMEMSHRGKEFISIYESALADLRTLLAVPANYKILFLQGGAFGQFSGVPMNLLGHLPADKRVVDYVNTGQWSSKAIAEAKRYAKVNIAATAEDRNFTYVPAQAAWKLAKDAAYVHICSNETIGGVEYFWTPETGGAPLVADMSSHILSRPIEVSRFGVIYAGAQKNIGPSGIVVVIVREDLLGRALPDCPSFLDYKQQAENDSMLNTPNTWGVYLAGLIFKWLLAKGGLAAIEKVNLDKAMLLYDYIDASGFYSNPVAKENRSRMNVPFRLKDEALDAEFLKGADARGLVQLKGHRSVGGMRASIYNAMPIEGVKALIDYMKEFAAKHG